MRFYLIFCFVFLVACDADKLNRFAANLNKNVEEKFEKLTSTSSELPSSTPSKPKLSTLEETNNTLKDINQTYKESKEQVKATKESISEGIRGAKQSAKNLARNVPKTEQQANKMFAAFMERHFGGWREKFRQLSRRNSGKAGSSNNPRKINESRLR